MTSLTCGACGFVAVPGAAYVVELVSHGEETVIDLRVDAKALRTQSLLPSMCRLTIATQRHATACTSDAFHTRVTQETTSNIVHGS